MALSCHDGEGWNERGKIHSLSHAERNLCIQFVFSSTTTVVVVVASTFRSPIPKSHFLVLIILSWQQSPSFSSLLSLGRETTSTTRDDGDESHHWASSECLNIWWRWWWCRLRWPFLTSFWTMSWARKGWRGVHDSIHFVSPTGEWICLGLMKTPTEQER